MLKDHIMRLLVHSGSFFAIIMQYDINSGWKFSKLNTLNLLNVLPISIFFLLHLIVMVVKYWKDKPHFSWTSCIHSVHEGFGFEENNWKDGIIKLFLHVIWDRLYKPYLSTEFYKTSNIFCRLPLLIALPILIDSIYLVIQSNSFWIFLYHLNLFSHILSSVTLTSNLKYQYFLFILNHTSILQFSSLQY